ncbi:hypothetical protein OXPF_29450 [Oxobacter pfennigii]|uniref:Phage tail assembly protein n=1 Tax=Oxobacter pfennigii TaxID=36849 RepID=A0A0N8NT07_9CLOT|nr:hypothetical protein [Oxobacter pfennigii]KPU43504.1 hypothetical protein OXPF_29450 [Oxobacter pfennigii]
MSFQIEYNFELQRGYVDKDGNIHKKGIMRLATAADEILPMRDVRVQQNQSYLNVIILSRVVTRLGDLKTIDAEVIENLFTADMDYLKKFYERINKASSPKYKFVCSKCGHENEADLDLLL